MIAAPVGDGATAAIARHAVASPPDRYAGQVRERAVAALVDTVAVALAARDEPVSKVVLEQAGAVGADSGASAWIADRRLDAPAAALVNATAAHALDYDDVCDAMWGHPSTVLLPAVCAWAEQTGASGAAALDAYAAGLDVACAIAESFPLTDHYAAGWHATTTLGHLAATAACARVAGLSVERARHALGVATSLASGSRANFGTMTKPAQAGFAARHAVEAVRLAQAGMTANPSALEAPFGFADLYGSPLDAAGLDAALAGAPALDRAGLNVKRHPCCYYLHRAVDAALELRSRRGIDPADVRSVHVTLEPGGQTPLIRRPPETGLEAKFSAPYCVAAALHDGELPLRAFDDAAVARAPVRRLLLATTVEERRVPPIGPAEWTTAYAVVEARLADGDAVRERVDVPIGHATRPLSPDELAQKVRGCLAWSGLEHAADSLLDALLTVPSAPLGDALARVRAAVGDPARTEVGS